MKAYRLESYKVGDETRYFWTIETKEGSTITLTLEQFQEMLADFQKKVDDRIKTKEK